MTIWASPCLTEPVLYLLNSILHQRLLHFTHAMPCVNGLCKLHRPCLLNEFLIAIGHKPGGKVFRLTQLCHVRCHLL